MLIAESIWIDDQLNKLPKEKKELSIQEDADISEQMYMFLLQKRARSRNY